MISTISTYRLSPSNDNFRPTVWYPNGAGDRSFIVDLVSDGPGGVEIIYEGKVVAVAGNTEVPNPLPSTGDWPTLTLSSSQVDPGTIASTTAHRFTGVGLNNYNHCKLTFKFVNWPEGFYSADNKSEPKLKYKDINLVLMYNEAKEDTSDSLTSSVKALTLKSK